MSSKIRSFVTMDDGTEVDILYYTKIGEVIMFTTKDGMYIYRPYLMSSLMNELAPYYQFYVLSPHEDGEIYPITAGKIRSITIDERVEYNVRIPGFKCYTILLKPEATADEMGLAIIKELGITWERKD